MESSKTTEEKILDSALDVFLEKGRHGAKMQEIADKAGINKALLHYYFRNKENLYAKIFEMVFRRFFSRIEQAVHQEMTFEDQLKAFISVYVDILDQNRFIPLFMAREMSEGGAMVSRIVGRMLEEKSIRIPELFLETLDRAVKRGEIRPVDPRQFIMTLIGASLFYFVAKPLLMVIFNEDDALAQKNFVEDRKAAIFDVLYYGVKPRGDQP